MDTLETSALLGIFFGFIFRKRGTCNLPPDVFFRIHRIYLQEGNLGEVLGFVQKQEARLAQAA